MTLDTEKLIMDGRFPGTLMPVSLGSEAEWKPWKTDETLCQNAVFSSLICMLWIWQSKFHPHKSSRKAKRKLGKQEIVLRSRSSSVISSWNGCEVVLKDCWVFICVESVWGTDCLSVLCSVKVYPSVPLIMADGEFMEFLSLQSGFCSCLHLNQDFIQPAHPKQDGIYYGIYYVSDAISSSWCSQVQEDISKLSPCLRPG